MRLGQPFGEHGAIMVSKIGLRQPDIDGRARVEELACNPRLRLIKRSCRFDLAPYLFERIDELGPVLFIVVNH